jgi:Family of unknown function (DUF6516)
MPDPLSSPAAYATFIYTLPERYTQIQRSTLAYIPSETLFGRAEGILFFADSVTLCVQEQLNFELAIIASYGYEVARSKLPAEGDPFPPAARYCQASYPHKDKLYWYDSFPHPNDPTLASTHPHHKHVHPNIKRNRIPAPHLSFTRLNLPFLIEEIEKTVLNVSP